VPVRGWDSVSVPGCVAAWADMHAKFGKLPFEKLFEAAIRYGREGFMVSPTIARQWAAQTPELKVQPGFADAFLPGGRPPQPGEVFKWADHAATLEKIAASKGKDFLQRRAGREDRGAREAEQRGDARLRPRRAQERLGGAAGDGLPRLHGARDPAQRPGHRGADRARHPRALRHEVDPAGFAESFHIQIEAQKLAFAMRSPTSPTSTTCRSSPERLLDKNYLAARRNN
jgi:gamma-glutamyltranspeptidase/glutathione hydrolase